VKSEIILPGSTIGVLGSGQLGRMFTLAARRMGYRVHTFSPDTDTPTGQVADLEITAAYDDLGAVADFARQVSVITFEFENVPAVTVETAERHTRVRPGGNVLHVTQHRLREKTFLRDAGFPVTPFCAVRSAAELRAAVASLKTPGVLKTAAFGYDGKGQATVRSLEEGLSSIKGEENVERIYEAFVDFDREVSVVAARGANGEFVHWGVMENSHRDHILDLTIAPPEVSPKVAGRAVEIARGILEKLDVVGVLCVEFFLTKPGELVVNELAPRPHNSGHLTIDACITSQFEQQLRAVCGLPLGATEQVRPAAMANLLGDLWSDGKPEWDRALALPGIKLHLYGKTEPRPGRKMGHITALADSATEAAELATKARAALIGK
jgi:5-(carboxyamino)imidazole ribonucleotide synthase